MRRLLLTAGCLLLGCHDPLSPAGGIQVAAGVVPASIKAGATMEIGIAVENGSKETREIAMSGCFPNFEILDQSGNVVGPGPRVCSLELRAPLRLGPNSVLDSTDEWTGESTQTMPTTGAPIYVPPGNYSLRPRVDVVGAGWVYGQLVAVTVVP